MRDREADFYQKLRDKMQLWLQSDEGKSHTWAEYLLFAPDLFHLLCKLAVDKSVPASEKTKLAAAIAYFVSPIDLMPEAVLGPLGFADDIALAAYVLNSVLSKTDPAIVRRHWAGSEDVLVVLQRILSIAEKMLGRGLWKKLRGRVD